MLGTQHKALVHDGNIGGAKLSIGDFLETITVAFLWGLALLCVIVIVVFLWRRFVLPYFGRVKRSIAETNGSSLSCVW
jgi:hypothetical protein